MAAAPDFARMMPGFDFLKSLAEGAGSAMPQMGSWVAPTLDPDELGKRIEELKTVQFWLEQNARMMATTVQALEVQRMTLSTLKGMNLQFGDLAHAFSVRPSSPAAAAAAFASTAAPAASAAPTAGAARGKGKPSRSSATGGGRPASARASQAPDSAGVVDPMQWWGSLTQQFAQLASKALQDAGRASAPAPSAPKTASAASSSPTPSAPPTPPAPPAPSSRAAAKASADAVPRSRASSGAAGRRKPR